MRFLVPILGAAVLLATPLASAEEVAPPAEAVSRTTVETGPSRGPFTPHGLSVTMGIGPTDFYAADTRDLAKENTGGFGDIRIAYGTRTYIGAEGVWWVTGRELDKKVVGEELDTPTLMGYGGEVLARGAFPMSYGELKYGPFAVAGLGWGNFGTTSLNEDDEMEYIVRDKVGTIPYGAGVAVSWKALYGEGRVMSRHAYDVDRLTDAAGNEANLDAWYAGLSVGATF